MEVISSALVSSCYLSSWSASASVALSVDDGGTALYVVFLGDPGAREGGEGSKGGTSLPDGVLSIGGSDDTDIGALGKTVGDLSLESVSETLVHGGTTGENNVLSKLLSHINVGVVDGVESESLHGLAGLTVQARSEEELRAGHSSVSLDGDDSLVGELEVHVVLGGVLGGGVLGFVVSGDISAKLLNVFDDFHLSGGSEGFTLLEEELLHVLGEDTSSDLHLLDGVGDHETLEDGDGVSNTITRVDDETSGSTGSVEGHDGLDGDIHVLDLEGLEHNLSHALSVVLGVTGSLSEENTGDLAGDDSELVVESVMPDFLHIIPGLDDTGGDGVGEVEDTFLLHGFITDVFIFVLDSLHGVLVLDTSNDGWEHSSWGFFSSNTGLDHAGTIVDDDCGLAIHT